MKAIAILSIVSLGALMIPASTPSIGWVAFSKKINHGSIAALTIEAGTSWGAKYLTTKYLKTKAPIRQTLLDHAHGFLFDTVGNGMVIYYNLRIIDETLIFRRHEEMVAVGFSVAFHTNGMLAAFSLFTDTFTQYIIVTKPNILLGMKITEESLMRKVNVGTGTLLALINVLLTAAGDRSPVYYVMTGQVLQNIDGMQIFTQIWMGLSFTGSVYCRTKVNKHIGTNNEASNQLLSNKFLVIYILFYSVMMSLIILAHFFLPPQGYKHLLDFMFFGGSLLFFALIIGFHQNLRQFVIKTIKDILKHLKRPLRARRTDPIHSLNAL